MCVCVCVCVCVAKLTIRKIILFVNHCSPFPCHWLKLHSFSCISTCSRVWWIKRAMSKVVLIAHALLEPLSAICLVSLSSTLAGLSLSSAYVWVWSTKPLYEWVELVNWRLLKEDWWVRIWWFHWEKDPPSQQNLEVFPLRLRWEVPFCFWLGAGVAVPKPRWQQSQVGPTLETQMFVHEFSWSTSLITSPPPTLTGGPNIS